MIYAKKSVGSDVHVFRNGRTDTLDCHLCKLTGDNESFDEAADLLTHLELHCAEGHTVPSDCLEKITGLVPKTKETAYLCAWIEVDSVLDDSNGGRIEVTEKPVIRGVSVFSEPSPDRIAKNGTWGVLLTGHGATLEDAIKDLRSRVEQWLPWLEAHVQWKR